jgi:nitrite reductase/ring-hydroxylating ferredoxin subunit
LTQILDHGIAAVSHNSARMLAPPESAFAAAPASWYLFGHATELRRPLTRKVLGRELVGFQTAGSQIAVLEARCAHLGADLGRGRVVGEAIQCPFHHWEYGVDGRCRRIPAQSEVPAFARQVSYPVAQRHGYVYFFHGSRPLFPLPFFGDCQLEELVAGRRFQFTAKCSWYMLAANLFDTQHWLTQHNRRVLGNVVIDAPHPFARRVCFEAEVAGSSIFDRLLRRFAGDCVQVGITCWAGNYFFATGFFPRVRSYIHVVSTPLDAEHLLVDVIVFARRCRNRLVGTLVEPISLWFRRLFTHAFMRGEFVELAGIRYSPQTLVKSDQELIDFFQWAASLWSGHSETEDGAARSEHGGEGRGIAETRPSSPCSGPCHPTVTGNGSPSDPTTLVPP